MINRSRNLMGVKSYGGQTYTFDRASPGGVRSLICGFADRVASGLLSFSLVVTAPGNQKVREDVGSQHRHECDDPVPSW